MATRFDACRVLCDADTAHAPGSVLVEEERILWVGPAAGAPAAETVVDLGEAVLIPGLVNAHSHLDLTHLKGTLAFDGRFTDWIDGVRRGRRAPGARAAALCGMREALSRGTTAFGDVVAPHSFRDIVSVFEEGGARGRLFVEALGFQPETADAVFETVWASAEMQALPATVSTGLSPHAPYSVSRALLSRLLAVADGHARPVAIHLAETLEELAFLRHGIGPIREMLKSLGKDDPDHQPFGSAAAFLSLLSLDRAPLLLVHGNYLRPRDVPLGATVVYCPTAHAFFRHPQHPVLELLEEGVRVALGSDSAASGETLDLLSETQHLARFRTDLDARAVFRMATEWGARALGLDSGRIAPGLLADLAAFTPPVGPEILGLPDARCVLTTVGGRILHRAEVAPAGDVGETPPSTPAA
ncbi:MAG: amidohydrolase family protein [Planctomycetaceae bacterium]